MFRAGTQQNTGKTPCSVCPWFGGLADPTGKPYSTGMANRGPTPSEPVRAEEPKRGRYRYPEELSAEERAQMARLLDVDGEAYLRWLAGEGPDPCPPESSD
jgi:hypothetical protein